MTANFSEGKYWVISFRRKILIKDLETTHLLNIVKMLVQQTERTTNLLIRMAAGMHTFICWPATATAMAYPNPLQNLKSCQVSIWIQKKLPPQ